MTAGNTRIRWGLAGGGVALMVIAAIFKFAAPGLPVEAGTVLITGANRGIGLALAREYAGRGWKVIATTRRPKEATELKALSAGHADVTIEQLDVTSDADISALRTRLKDVPIDVLLNNAGSNAGGQGQKFGAFDYDVLDDLMAVNVVAPLKMSQAFLPNVLASKQKKIVVISSVQASIARTFGGSYFYRASKVALNMVMRTLSRDLKDQDVTIGILSPGVVSTDMTKGLDYPMITPEKSAHSLANVIAGLTPERSGEFIEYDGTSLPW